MAQYLKPDSELGYIEDNAQIECLKFNNLRHSILGCMLGDFNEVGNYVVSPEIVKELISMEKYIVQTYDNIELCKGFLKLDKQISFMVTFEGNRATLSLIEKMNYEANFSINSGTYSNINEYMLDSVETSGEINRNVIYDRWNISSFGGNVVDIFNCDDSVLEKYFGIVNRFKYLLQANKIMLEKEEEIEEIEAAYSNEIFEILKRYPKLEKSVLETVKQTLTEKKDAVSIKKPFFAKTFNEVLENAIEKNLGILEDNQKQEFEIEKRNAVLNLTINRENIIEMEHKKIDNAENELSPTLISLSVPTTVQSKSISELGEEFISTYKVTTDALSPEQKPKEQPDKDKLIATLIGAGVGALIGGATGAVVGATAENLVAEISDKKNSSKSAESSAGKSSDKKPEVKKPQAKKTQVKKLAEKKPQAKKSQKNKPKDKTKEVEYKNQTEESGGLNNLRFLARLLAGGSETEKITTAEPTVRKKKTHEVAVERFDDMAKIKVETKTYVVNKEKQVGIVSVTTKSEVSIDELEL